MNKNNFAALTVVVVVAIVFSSIIANALFNKSQTASVSVVQPINSTFPDVKSDPNYKSIFNSHALDPTQLIKIGTSQNNSPFNGGQ